MTISKEERASWRSIKSKYIPTAKKTSHIIKMLDALEAAEKRLEEYEADSYRIVPKPITRERKPPRPKLLNALLIGRSYQPAWRVMLMKK